MLVGPFARYYHHTDYFLHAGAGFGNQTQKSDFAGTVTTFKYPMLGFDAGIGRAIFLTEFTSIEPMIKYSWDRIDYGGFTESTGGLVIQIYLGIYIE